MSTVFSAVDLVDHSPDRATELLWQDAMTHLEATNNEVLLPMNVVEIIGQQNVDKLQARLSTLLDKQVESVEDITISALRLMPVPDNIMPVDTECHQAISRAVHAAAFNGVKMPVKSSKVPRPPNSFILYRQYHHHNIKTENPGISNNDISRIVGAKWREESQDVRAHFKALADEMKRQHAIDHPDYQYAPRRPGEKRRRSAAKVNTKHLQFLANDEDGALLLSNANMNDNYVQVDEELIELLDKHNLLFGPNGVEPLQIPDNLDEFDSIVNDQLQRRTLETLIYDPLPGDEIDTGFDFEEFVTDLH